MTNVKRILGNWKMNGCLATNEALLNALLAGAERIPSALEVGVCVPFPYLFQAQSILKHSRIAWGAQDVSIHAQGAFTGQVAATMLHDFAARYVIVGHSERRQYQAETDQDIAQKTLRALDAQLTPVVCVGETLAQRQAQQTQQVVQAQLTAVLSVLSAQQAQQIVLAYEPVWAIGTGQSATIEEIQAVHYHLRTLLKHKQAEQVSILYGGSVKPDNARQIFAQPDVDGGLIGGASLNSDDFLSICLATSAAV